MREIALNVLVGFTVFLTFGSVAWGAYYLTHWGRCKEIHSLTALETYASPFLGCMVKQNGTWTLAGPEWPR